MENRKYMTVAQMGEMLGLKKTDSYWLVHKKLFETKKLAGKTLVIVSSFEKWYENQIKYHKVCGTEPGLMLRKHSYSARDISILLDVINRGRMSASQLRMISQSISVVVTQLRIS